MLIYTFYKTLELLNMIYLKILQKLYNNQKNYTFSLNN